MQRGAVDFLLKPVDDEALLAAIATALAQDTRTQASQRHRAEVLACFATLTPREREVMGLVSTGVPNKDIAATLGTTEKTIKAHRARGMQKMRATSIAALVRMAALLGLGEPRMA
jgi:FixJ family two-component response regulator